MYYYCVYTKMEEYMCCEKDYKSMTYDEALELNQTEFSSWCKAHPVEISKKVKEMIKEVKGDIDESN
jgi:hypothetical protein